MTTTEKALIEALLTALRCTDAALNPPERGYLSPDERDRRAVSATAEVRAAVEKAEAFLKNHA